MQETDVKRSAGIILEHMEAISGDMQRRKIVENINLPIFSTSLLAFRRQRTQIRILSGAPFFQWVPHIVGLHGVAFTAHSQPRRVRVFNAKCAKDPLRYRWHCFSSAISRAAPPATPAQQSSPGPSALPGNPGNCALWRADSFCRDRWRAAAPWARGCPAGPVRAGLLQYRR